MRPTPDMQRLEMRARLRKLGWFLAQVTLVIFCLSPFHTLSPRGWAYVDDLPRPGPSYRVVKADGAPVRRVGHPIVNYLPLAMCRPGTVHFEVVRWRGDGREATRTFATRVERGKRYRIVERDGQLDLISGSD